MKNRLNINLLRKELIELQEHEKHRILGGQDSSSQINSVFEKIMNGDFTNVPAGRYDFNTNTFTPIEDLDTDIIAGVDWYINIETVNVTRPYNYNESNYQPDAYDPNGMLKFQEDFFKNFIDNALRYQIGSNPGGGAGGGSGVSSGVFYMSSTASSIPNLTPSYPENNDYGGQDIIELERMVSIYEHYANNDMGAYYKYAFSSSLFSDSLGITNNLNLINFLNIGVDNSNIDSATARQYFQEVLTIASQGTSTVLTSLFPNNMISTLISLGSNLFTDKLDTNFENTLFDRYWSGETSLFNLNEGNHFNNILDKNITFNQNTSGEEQALLNSTTYNGETYRFQGISLYGDPTYDYSIGSAVGIFNSSGQMVGLFDTYNFNPSDRNSEAEFATRLVNAVSPFNATGFDIYGGNLSSSVYEAAKQYQQSQESK